MVRLTFRSRQRDPERGAVAVEFAMVVPILVALTIGTIDAGRMIVAKQMCAYAAIVGARTALAKVTVVSGTTTTITATEVRNAAIAAAPLLHLTTSNIPTVSVSGSTTTFANRTRGDKVTVVVTYTFTPVIPLLTKLATKNYSVTSAMVIP